MRLQYACADLIDYQEAGWARKQDGGRRRIANEKMRGAVELVLKRWFEGEEKDGVVKVVSETLVRNCEVWIHEVIRGYKGEFCV